MIDQGDRDGLGLAQDPALLQELAQLRAKATLTEVLGTSPDFRWRYEANRVLRNLVLLQFRLAQQRPDRVAAMAASRVIAEAWESLGVLGDRVQRDAALLNAAVQPCRDPHPRGPHPHRKLHRHRLLC